MTRLRTANKRAKRRRGTLLWTMHAVKTGPTWADSGASVEDITRDLDIGMAAMLGVTADQLTECGCVPGHRSTVLTHTCEDCGFRDCDYYDGNPVPPCPGRASPVP